MVGEQERPEDVVWGPSTPLPPAKRSGGRLKRIAIGASVSFVFMSALYGVDQAAQMVFLTVVCTAGVGLIPLLFLSWMVGWIVLAVRDAIATRSGAASVS